MVDDPTTMIEFTRVVVLQVVKSWSSGNRPVERFVFTFKPGVTWEVIFDQANRHNVRLCFPDAKDHARLDPDSKCAGDYYWADRVPWNCFKEVE